MNKLNKSTIKAIALGLHSVLIICVIFMHVSNISIFAYVLITLIWVIIIITILFMAVKNNKNSFSYQSPLEKISKAISLTIVIIHMLTIGWYHTTAWFIFVILIIRCETYMGKIK